MGNSCRRRPLEPPLSATVTIAVISEVIFLTADSVAAKPCPPPKQTTGEFFSKFIPVQHLGEKHAHLQ